MRTTNQNHDETIIHQFSKQAIPFTKLSGHLDSIEMLLEMSHVNKMDTVLDVACGPGLVACVFAKTAKHVTGIDITKEMITQAKKYQQKQHLLNLSWDIGTALPLPYESESFSVVITRYSFHHFVDPQAILSEMFRVCKQGGVVLVADVSLPKEKIEAFNQMEKLRDPSHTQALSLDQFEEVMFKSGLKNLRCGNYKVEMELEKQLKASFPNPNDEEKIREIFYQDIDLNSLGMNAHKIENEVHFTYPISIYAGNK
ncbi:MAG: ubiquinone/menaquinone biosynthesis C-methylase UbiE [bacterium]|jgi:ubiquinone/menaquinone biosynthesis C-methylase UbiE